MKTLESVITSVTVFRDRAQITREGTFNIIKGEESVQFKGLPEAIEQNSIQVKGSGSAVLKDITFKKEHFTMAPNEMQKELYRRKEELDEKLLSVSDSINQANKEKEFIDNIAKKLTGISESDSTVELDPEKWIKMVDFYRRKNEELDKEIRSTMKEEAVVRNDLEKVMNEIYDIDYNQNKTLNNVEILLNAKEDGAVILQLTYIVYGPKWTPFYDLRVDTDTKKMELNYHAMILQNTGEDWKDINLNLSTAQPQRGGEQPALIPWHLEVFQPSRMKVGAAAPEPIVMAANMYQMHDDDLKEEAASGDYPDAIEPEEANIQTNTTSVIFKIPGKNSILSDNNEHSVTIMIREFNAKFRYSTVPKLSEFAYLKTKVKNETEFPFLPGKTNVFMDNNFVAHASINNVSPDEEFWTYLGVDEGIKIEHKFLKKYQKNNGFFHKRNKYIYEYLIEITNNKKTEEEIVIWDQIPITNSDNIIINLIEPKYEKDTDKLKRNEFNFFEWFYSIESMKKVVIPFSFSVEYSKELEIIGLE